jgi:hypothetical protein
MPPTPPPAPVPAGPPTRSYQYEALQSDGNWQIGSTSGVAIYADAGAIKSDTLAFVGRSATASVFGPQSGTQYHADGWVFAATDTSSGPSGHWFFGAFPFQPATSPGPYYIVAYNQDPHGTPVNTMQFMGWESLCERTP